MEPDGEGEHTKVSRPFANDVQVGGEHYRTSYQHWDMIEEHGIGYLEAAATKYISRWRNKDGLLDLEKALHYTAKLVEIHEHQSRQPRGFVPTITMDRFANANSLTETEYRAISKLVQWTGRNDLNDACDLILKLIAECKNGTTDANAEFQDQEDDVDQGQR